MSENRLHLTLTRDEVRMLYGNAILPARERFDPMKAPKTVALLDSLIKNMREWLAITPEEPADAGTGDPLAPLCAELYELLTWELATSPDPTALGLLHNADPAETRRLISKWRKMHQHEGREVPDYLELADRLERRDRKAFLSRIKAIAVRADDDALVQVVERVASEVGETLW